MMYFPGLCYQARDSEAEEGSCGGFPTGTPSDVGINVSISPGLEGDLGFQSLLQMPFCFLLLHSVLLMK